MPTRSHVLTHRKPRGARRVAALMLLVQLLLLLATAWPTPVPARAGAAGSDAGVWVVVCSPQGMKQVLLSSLVATDHDAPRAPASSDEELPVRGAHCLLCVQQQSPALPLPAAASLVAATPRAAPAPDWWPQPPRERAPVWRALLARAPPLNS